MIIETVQIMYSIIPVEIKIIIMASIIFNIIYYIKEKGNKK
jgi:hypothetical protein